MITGILRFFRTVSKATTGSRAAVTFPWMAMNYVASERPDSRFEQHRRSYRDVFCGLFRSPQALFSRGSSLPIRHRWRQCDLCIFLRALVSVFRGRLLALSGRRPMRYRSSFALRLLTRYHAPIDAFNRRIGQHRPGTSIRKLSKALRVTAHQKSADHLCTRRWEEGLENRS